MRQVIIAAPFGNYLFFLECTSTLGTFTLLKRAGLLRRIWRCIRTLRPLPRRAGWINQLGLPNPGVAYLAGKALDASIVSLHGFQMCEWTQLLTIALSYCVTRPSAIELNISCPNVGAIELSSLREIGQRVLATNQQLCAPKPYLGDHTPKIIVKLPPVRWMPIAGVFYDLGIRHFHCCNTIPTPGGGVSGKVLMNYSLWAVEQIKETWPDTQLIGGGGISCMSDACRYLSAGASHVSVAGAILTKGPLFPLRLARELRKNHNNAGCCQNSVP